MKKILFITAAVFLLVGCFFGFGNDKAKGTIHEFVSGISDGITYVLEYNGDTGFGAVPAADFAMAANMPTNNNQLTNGMGFITASGVPAQSWPSITGKPTTISGYGITDSYTDTKARAAVNYKRRETYSGVTAATGLFSVIFATPYTVAPNIQANIINGADNQNLRITAVSATGFTVLVRNRVDVIGLLPTWNNAANMAVDILINEK